MAEERKRNELEAAVLAFRNAEPEERTAMNAWAALLARLASADRPVVLALHPGTRAALDADDIRLSPDIRVIEPQGYRTTLGLQLHAAAVVTDSGGVQREAAWLRVPCLVLRGTTEWVEAVAAQDQFFVQFGSRLPAELHEEHDTLARAVAATMTPPHAGPPFRS